MRVSQVSPDRTLVTREAADPVPGPRQAVVEVAYCGICGSDIHMLPIPEFFAAGAVPRHEFSGRIVALGEGGGIRADAAAGGFDAPAGGRVWQLGDRVAVLPFGQCGECSVCLGGNEEACPQAVPAGIGLGGERGGGFAERVLVDQRYLFALPDSLDDRGAAFTEPTAIGVRGVEAAGAPLDASVAVIGAGIIGVLTALVLRARGYTSFTLVSRNAGRSARAAALGLPVMSDAEFSARAVSEPPAYVIDCAGTPSSALQAIEALAPVGTLVLVGLSLEPLVLPAPLIVIKELQIRGAIGYKRTEFAEAIQLLASGAIPVESLVTDEVGLEDAQDAFDRLSVPNDHLKVLLKL